MLMLELVVILSVLLLVACSHLPPPPPPPVPTHGGLVIDSGLVAACQQAPVLESGKESDVVTWGLNTKKVLKDCSDRHDGLINALKALDAK